MSTSLTDDLTPDYRRAGFGGALAFGARPALLVVDVVRAYVEPSRPLYAQGVVDALEPNRRLVAAARGAGVTVIFTCVRYDAEGRDGGQFFRMVLALKGFVASSPLGAFASGLEPAAGETVVVKQRPKYAEVIDEDRALAEIASFGARAPGQV